MCHISGSYDFQTVVKLAKQGLRRGNTTHSFTILKGGDSPTGFRFDIFSQIRNAHGLTDSDIESHERYSAFLRSRQLPSNPFYYIYHTQAPTSTVTTGINVHPAISHCDEKSQCWYVWHNGIIKSIDDVDVRRAWDTKALADYLCDTVNDTQANLGEALGKIDGSFACLALKQPHGFLYLIKNKAAPMFIDAHGNVCSTRFNGSYSTDSTPESEYCDIYSLSFDKWVVTGKAYSLENPFKFNR